MRVPAAELRRITPADNSAGVGGRSPLVYPEIVSILSIREAEVADRRDWRGPGGLYFAYLWKKRHPEDQVDLFEQNPADATWGFGVVFSDQALEFLRADDPETVDAIAPYMESWENITLNHGGDSVAIDGVGFSSIGRLELLQFLQQRALDAGVTARFDTPVQPSTSSTATI